MKTSRLSPLLLVFFLLPLSCAADSSTPDPIRFGETFISINAEHNVVYYSWFDTAVNAHLIDQGVLDIHAGGTIGLVIETQCNYFAPLAFPQTVEAGIRVARLGGSSVRYEVGLFAQGEPLTAAAGHFIHVYVDRETRRPVPVPEALRTVLQALVVPG